MDSSTTVSSFNDLMGQFLDDLEIAFPNDKGIQKYQASFMILRKAQPRKPLNEFMKSVTPLASQIMNKDEQFFLDSPPGFLETLNIKELWTQATQENKDAIWQYVQTLYIIGTTISSLPPEALAVIEDVAKKCAESLKGTEFLELLGKNPMKM